MVPDRQARTPGGFGAGVGAALVMMLVMAVLRFTTNTSSIPELLEKSADRLVGGQLEIFFTNICGVGGKALLLVIFTQGTLLLHGVLGMAFARFWPMRRGIEIADWRWVSGVLYGLITGLVYNVVFLFEGLEAGTPLNSTVSDFSSSPVPFGLPVWLDVFVLGIFFGLMLVALLAWPREMVAPVPTGEGRDIEGAPTSLVPRALSIDHPTPMVERMSRRDFTKVVAGGALAVAGSGPLWFGVRSALASTSLVSRASYAANNTGWRFLGALNGAYPSKANFRESDILYNPDDRMYYVFSTEGDGNPPPPTPITSSSAGSPTTIIARGHRLRVGMQVYITEHRDDLDDTNSALNYRYPYINYQVSAVNIGGDPDTFQLVLASDGVTPVSSPGGYGGWLNYRPDPHVAMRRASTPEGIARAEGDDYVEYICPGVWYPTVLKEGNHESSSWHLWGTTRTVTINHFTFRGNRPGPQPWRECVTVGPPLLLGDISIRRNPADGFWYAVGLYNNSNTDIRIFRSKDILNGNKWEQVGAVFADEHPAWASYSTPDPNICFADGKAYVLFTGGSVDGIWSTGIVEVDIKTGKAKGPSTVLTKYGGFPEWADSGLSDLVFVPSGHDGVDRIYGFSGVPYFSGQNAVWGCLDLPVS